MKPEGVRRVAFGDSIAFGYWVAEEDTLARQLESVLGEVRGDGPAVEVLGFGVPGYNLEQEIETLRSRALLFEPDVVVLAFCLNDLEGIFSYELGLVQDRATRRRSVLGRLREGLLSRSHLFRLARVPPRRARRAPARCRSTRNPLAGPLYEQAWTSGNRAGSRVLQSILASRGIEGVVAVFPSFTGPGQLPPPRPRTGWSGRPPRRRAFWPSTSSTATPATTTAGRCASTWSAPALGHRVAAHAIRDTLCAHGLLCPAPARRRSHLPRLLPRRLPHRPQATARPSGSGLDCCVVPGGDVLETRSPDGLHRRLRMSCAAIQKTAIAAARRRLVGWYMLMPISM